MKMKILDEDLKEDSGSREGLERREVFRSLKKRGSLESLESFDRLLKSESLK